MNKIIIFIFGALFSLCVSSVEKYNELPENFINLIQKNEFHKAIDFLYAHEEDFDWKSPEGIATKNKFSKDMENLEIIDFTNSCRKRELVSGTSF